ncbi:MAG: hypothetical protein ACOYKR_06055 [Sphingobacterium thalpophilum]
MEQVNQQEKFKQLFLKCIADPLTISEGDSKILEAGLANFPYCQVLNLFYSRSLSLSDNEKLNNQPSFSAILIPERKILYTILNEPEKLKENEKLKYIESVLFGEQDPNDEGIHEIENSTDHFEENFIWAENKIAPVVTSEKPDNQLIEGDLISSIIESKYEGEIAVEAEKDKHPDKDDIWSAKIVSASEIDSEPVPELEQLAIKSVALPEKSEDLLGDSIQTEIEIEEINLSEQPDENEEKETIEETGHDRTESPEDKVEEHTLSGDIFHTITQSTESEVDLKIEEKLEKLSDIEESNQTEVNQDLRETSESSSKDSSNLENKDSKTDQELSAYDDDKMPYSFLWWLQKTRMEYSSAYQPYADLKLDTNQDIKLNSVDQLSNQIIENIFHLQSPLEKVENAPRTVPFQIKRKEDSILEKFIKEEPQIKPPNSQKLDTENKARKSAEDPNDLVSETLAQIYADQMLYLKAISTYKILSLKVPEKSTYFADRILELEKKVNL